MESVLIIRGMYLNSYFFPEVKKKDGSNNTPLERGGA